MTLEVSNKNTVKIEPQLFFLSGTALILSWSVPFVFWMSSHSSVHLSLCDDLLQDFAAVSRVICHTSCH